MVRTRRKRTVSNGVPKTEEQLARRKKNNFAAEKHRETTRLKLEHREQLINIQCKCCKAERDFYANEFKRILAQTIKELTREYEQLDPKVVSRSQQESRTDRHSERSSSSRNCVMANRISPPFSHDEETSAYSNEYSHRNDSPFDYRPQMDHSISDDAYNSSYSTLNHSPNMNQQQLIAGTSFTNNGSGHYSDYFNQPMQQQQQQNGSPPYGNSSPDSSQQPQMTAPSSFDLADYPSISRSIDPVDLVTPLLEDMVVMIGESGAGKTCILNRFAKDMCRDSFNPTIGVGVGVREMNVKEERVKLQVWDTAGQERFQAITSSYYRGADAILLVYDITNAYSFERIDQWMERIGKYAPENVIIMLIGAKCDMQHRREVSKKLGEKFATDHSMFFMETSAKENIGIDTAFYQLAEAILERPKTSGSNAPGPARKTIKLSRQGKLASTKTCCIRK